MTPPEALKLVRQYIFDKTGKRVDTKDLFIQSDSRQLEMLKSAVEVAVRHYRAKQNGN